MVAKLRLIGIPVPEIALMSFDLIDAIVKEHERQNQVAKGDRPDWEPDAIPTPADPTAPPPKAHFVSYGVGLGLSPKRAEAYYDRQLKVGGTKGLPDGTKPRPDPRDRHPHAADHPRQRPGRQPAG